MFCCEFCKIFKNTIFIEHLLWLLLEFKCKKIAFLKMFDVFIITKAAEVIEDMIRQLLQFVVLAVSKLVLI